jgi:hypothetical protein
VAGGRARDRAACEGIRQVGAHGWDFLARRLRVRCRKRPEGKELKRYRRAFSTPRDGVRKDGTIGYRASTFDCEACPLKSKCSPNTVAPKIARSIYEAARDKARAIAKTAAYIVSRGERRKVEIVFAHLKRILKLDRLRLRGPNGAKDEFPLAATAQTLRKLAKLVPFSAPTFAA